MEVSEVRIGVHFSPEKFVCAAGTLHHPFPALALSELFVSSSVSWLRSSVRQVVEVRRGACAAWRQQPAELEHRDAELRAGMNQGVLIVLKRKCLLLFAAMLRQTGFPIHDLLVHHVVTGFPLAGKFLCTEVLPSSPP